MTIATKNIQLSLILKSPLLDSTGEQLGKVKDLIVRLDEHPHPPVSGILAKIGSRELFVPIGQVASIEPGRVQLRAETLNLRRFERRERELLLARDLSTHHLINIVGARLVRANEIEISNVDGRWEVVGVDPSPRPLLAKLLPGLKSSNSTESLVDWASIEPFVSHVPTAKLRIPYRKLAKLHPAQIADLVEAASHEEGEEIIEAVGQDLELEADVFEELDRDHQLEFINSRSNKDAVSLLSKMKADDVADLIVDVDQERRLILLDMLPDSQRAKVRNLLNYHPQTAGGLMSPDFLYMPEAASVEQALENISSNPAAPESLAVVFVYGDETKLSGAVGVIQLLKSPRHYSLKEVVQNAPAFVTPDVDIHIIMRTMADYNLTVLPVVNDDLRVIGIITVDDLLEQLLPEGWRRDFRMSTDQE